MPDTVEPSLQQVTPDDPLFAGTSGQWWLQPVSGSDQLPLDSRLRGVPGLQTAWSRSTGDAAPVLAVLDTQRHPAMPNVPTMIEAGVKDFEITAWFGFMAPGGTPKAIVDKVSRDVKTVLRNPEVNKQISDSLAEVIGSTPEEYDAFIRAEIKKWAEVIVKAKMKDD